MRKNLLAAVSALILLAGFEQANAADIPVKAPRVAPAAAYNWSGFYVGGTVGYNNGSADWFFHNAGLFPQDNPHEIEGWNGGGFVGLQWQTGNVVLGVEANGLWGDIRGWSICPSGIDRCHTSVDDLWTVGGRLGLVWGASGRFMTYISGGWASAKVDTTGVTIATGAVLDTTSARHDGWYIGGGLDFTLVGNWIFGVEYRHYQLEDGIHVSSLGNPLIDRTVKPEWDSLQFRLSYKFGWAAPIVARY